MLNILILCAGNSCRSVLGEALINHLVGDRFRAFPAGSHPTGKVNPSGLTILGRNGIPTDGFTSQSLDEFDGKDIDIDIAITVCDQAAGQMYPFYLNSAIKTHWGLPEPAHAIGTDEEIAKAFQATYEAQSVRIHKMLALPIEEMDSADITRALNEIGNQS